MAAMLGTSRCVTRNLGRVTSQRIKVQVSTRGKQTSPGTVAALNIFRAPSACQSKWASHHTIQTFIRKGWSVRGIWTTVTAFDDFKIVKTPPFAESVTEGDVRWEKAVGDYVNEDEVVGEIETDKTSIPVPSPVSGVIEEFFAADGDTVTAGQELLKVKVTAGGAPTEKPAAAADKPAPAAVPSPPQPAAPAPAAPAAPAAGPIPTTPPPLPPLPQQPITAKPVADMKPVAAAAPAMGVTAGARTENRVKMNRMRQRIAQRLKDAQNECAMLTTFQECDMSGVIEMRSKHKDGFLKKHGVKLGFMSPFVKAAAFALQDQPVVNAVIEDKEIVYRDYIDISVAVATPKGLVVPVIRDVGNMNYADIEKTINDLGEKARKGELAIEDMDGGTFTISNGGVFGSMFGTPIINQPQSAILGMHAILERPMAINGKVEIRPMMYLALTYDHRLIDGREAVTFLRKIKSAVEDPRVLVLDL
ncbi:dihydrolipoyllysine-residue succinyltransferase component of 2-oxoglutarate dehydrogenase complex, mitochondrial-like [Branchiostoma floridae]|uniref:Dihydrolipoyllysine-residue succinyltransferase component of 2-oxoglutarate dehydrogenase complex, mitochondrial n=1 Tax=Branchiostoma floridae TaxID=7739 RepID=A0A9J7N2Z7_BRAFL|nr:dihydrolipoyllysine-residue succinyltransferase component of 2-oxoglutarate dehydrogenase complex, mitochondrial-like [Branchiostoma floridae]